MIPKSLTGRIAALKGENVTSGEICNFNWILGDVHSV